MIVNKIMLFILALMSLDQCLSMNRAPSEYSRGSSTMSDRDVEKWVAEQAKRFSLDVSGLSNSPSQRAPSTVEYKSRTSSMNEEEIFAFQQQQAPGREVVENTFNMQKYFSRIVPWLNQQQLIPNKYLFPFATYKDFCSVVTSITEYHEKNLERVTVPIGAEVVLVRDLNGDIHALIAMIKKLQQYGYLDQHLTIIKPKTYIIFPYFESGAYAADVIFTASILKIRNPDCVFLASGNSAHINTFWPKFNQEIEWRYPPKQNQDAFMENMIELFQFLPSQIFLEILEYPEEDGISCCNIENMGCNLFTIGEDWDTFFMRELVKPVVKWDSLLTLE